MTLAPTPPDISIDSPSFSGETSRMTDDFFAKYGFRILRAMRKMIRAVDIHSRKLNTEFKITAPQMICLYSLMQDGPMTLSALAESVSLSASTTNGIVDRLEKKEFLVRQRDHVDRRKVYLHITDTGRELTTQAPALLQDQLSDALQHLPELEQAAIALSLERVVELMGARHLDASPNLVPTDSIEPQKEA
ncbi:MAG: MarR family winged helix-turn-helix transcriptional regulator [Phycisphaeraceae bacterium JB051]